MCIGNELLMDEGVGPAVARYLLSRYEFPPEVEVLDRAVMGMAIISDLRTCDYMVVLDAVQVPGAEPGQLFSFAPDDVAPTAAGMTSLHDVRFADVLGSAELLGIHAEGHCFGIQVENMSPSEFVMALTPRVAAALPLLAQTAVRFVRDELGLEVVDVLAGTDPLRAGCGAARSRDFSRAGVRCEGGEPGPPAAQPCLPEVYGAPDASVMAGYLAAGLAAVGAKGRAEAVPACGDAALDAVPVMFELDVPSVGASDAAAELCSRFGVEHEAGEGDVWACRAWVRPETTDYDCDNLIGACRDAVMAAMAAGR
jgi:hydrogenase maturation protease